MRESQINFLSGIRTMVSAHKKVNTRAIYPCVIVLMVRRPKFYPSSEKVFKKIFLNDKLKMAKFPDSSRVCPQEERWDES